MIDIAMQACAPFVAVVARRRTRFVRFAGHGLRAGVLLAFGVALLVGAHPAKADTTLSLFKSFAGNVNFIGTQKTLRRQSDSGNSCSITNGNTNAVLSGLPAGATVEAAYLYWAGSGNTPDYDVTFEGGAVAADTARRYTATFTFGGTNYNYFSGVTDVTATVAAKGNGTYRFSGLTVDNGNPWCGSSAVLGGWALLVVYSQAAEDFRVVNVYEGFEHFRGSSITLTPNNFLIPNSPINGKDAHLTWEGDPGNSAPLGGFNEELTFNGNTLTDASNPPNNQFNSVSTINGDTASYGVDFDVYDISAYLAAGQTSATTVYSSGGDLVLLSSQIISTTNAAVADLAISMTRNGNLVPGQNASYTLNVVNNGPLDEPGPIGIVDTLPAGLSYVSASGSGWTCSVAGQDVTCNRSGSLVSGASAPSLTLTVAVAAGATGSITNTATVSGQAFDNISSNNTATDTYALPAAPIAYYAMDEASWSGAAGEVVDSSGNGNNGVAVGGAQTIDPAPTPTPISPGNCRAGATVNDGESIDTGVDVDSVLGNTGTVTFWFRPNWTEAGAERNTARVLFDASMGGKYFKLAKLDNRNGVYPSNNARRRLALLFEDSVDADFVAYTSSQPNFTANTWIHIAVTWDFPGDHFQIYLDGVLAADQTINTSGAIPAALDTLYFGDTRGSYIPYNITTVADGAFDEVRLYNSVLTQSEIQADRNAAHACVTVDHFALSHSGTGVTCQAEPVTVTAHDAAHAPSTSYTGSVTLSTSTNVGDWSVATGSGVFNNGTANDGVATYTFAAADNGTATFNLKHTVAGAVNINVADGSITETSGTATAAEDPVLTFADSGFRFIDAANAENIVTQVAGQTSGTYYLQAIRTDTSTGACVGVFGAGQTVNIDLASQCNDPTTCNGKQVTFTNNAASTVLASNPNAAVASYTTTPVTFLNDGTSRAAFAFNYPDVGRISLHARYNIPLGSGGASATNMIGASNPFVVKPFGFVLSSIVRTSDNFPNPGAVDATGGAFVGAGQSFSATATAVIADGSTAAPNYGRETTPEGVTATKVLVAPAGGNDPPLTGSFGVFGQDCSGAPAAAGTACGTFTWTEVGVIQLTPNVADGDYLGVGNVSGTGQNVGRFYPDHFTLTGGSVTNRVDAGCAPASAFSYMGEILRLGFTLTAQSASPGNSTTQNYAGAFAKLNPATIGALNIGAIDAAAPTPLTGRITLDTSSGAWTTGVAPIQARLSLNRAAAVDGPFQSLRFGVAPADTDGVGLLSSALDLDVDNDATNDHGLVATTDVRYGRLFLQNAFGSELVPLPMPLRAEYYAGASAGFVTNTNDGCSAVTNLALSNAVAPTPVSGATPLSKNVGTASTTATIGNPTFVAGDAGLSFSAPGAGGDGYVDVDADIGTPAWLKFDWDGNAGTPDVGPTGRATFGIYKGSPRQIYLRERY